MMHIMAVLLIRAILMILAAVVAPLSLGAAAIEVEGNGQLPHWRPPGLSKSITPPLEREESQRAAFLKEAFAGDEALRREVESLLAH